MKDLTSKYFGHRNGYTSYSCIQELKKKFKKLAFELHQDKGGSKEAFQEMSNDYQEILEYALRSEYKNESKIDTEMQIDKEMRAVLDKIIHLQSVIIEIVGNWIWITGNTYPVKDIIKQAGFKFARKKTAWYWNDGNYKKKTKKQFTLDEIKAMHGSQEIGTFNGNHALNESNQKNIQTR